MDYVVHYLSEEVELLILGNSTLMVKNVNMNWDYLNRTYIIGNILFDKNISYIFCTEDIVVLTEMVVHSL